MNLWGIETEPNINIALILMSVNWTCEGLKRLGEVSISPLISWCELNLWGIETVVLQVVFQSFFLCELNLWGIETKLLQILSSHNYVVWIEPVRDWNKSKFNQNQKSKPGVNWTCEGLKLKLNPLRWYLHFLCELNLWGIETHFPFWREEEWQQCELNLWGIETPIHYIFHQAPS